MKFVTSLARKIGEKLSLFFFVGIPTLFKRLKALVRRYSNKRTVAALLIVGVFLTVGIGKGLLSNGIEDETEKNQREVRTAPAGLISQLEAIFETTGEVKSQTQGDLRAQRAGVITQVNVKDGQYVRAGTIIAAIENASERASVAQAQAGVAQAQASFNKVKGGTRDEQLAVLSATTQSAEQSLEETLVSIKNTLLSAYATTDSVFAGGVDAMFSDPDGANPKLKFASTNSSRALLAEHERFLLEATIDRHVAATGRVGLSDTGVLKSEIQTVEQEMFKIKSTLDNLISALDGAVSNASVSSATITSYKTTAAAARTSVLATLSSLSTARGALNSAQSALDIAKENETQGVTGAQVEDIEVAQAQLDSARASLAQAVAQLENTRVRAPVSGAVTILTVNPGDFVSAFQDIGLIANEGALEIVTFVSPSAVERLSVGGKALIDGTYEGVITSIALGLDPVKRQVEVHVALVSDEVNVTHGSRVPVKFLTLESEIVNESTTILVPISALKLVGSDAFVFTVLEDSTLEAHKVELGAVVQASVEIVSGITRDTVIVLDARGLNAGDTVIVEN